MKDDRKAIANDLQSRLGAALSHANNAQRVAHECTKIRAYLIDQLAEADTLAKQLRKQIKEAQKEAKNL